MRSYCELPLSCSLNESTVTCMKPSGPQSYSQEEVIVYDL